MANGQSNRFFDFSIVSCQKICDNLYSTFYSYATVRRNKIVFERHNKSSTTVSPIKYRAFVLSKFPRWGNLRSRKNNFIPLFFLSNLLRAGRHNTHYTLTHDTTHNRLGVSREAMGSIIVNNLTN